MKILLVLAHPDQASFNHALARSVRDALEEAGHEVSLRDLYSEPLTLCCRSAKSRLSASCRLMSPSGVKRSGKQTAS